MPVAAIAARTAIQSGKPVNGSVVPLVADARTPSLWPSCLPEEADAPEASPAAGFEPGSFDGFSSVVVVVVGGAIGGPRWGCGCGCGVGDGAGPPQLSP